MVHAEASQFSTGLNKDQIYERVIEQASALFEGQRNWVCNLSNAASLLYHGLNSMSEPTSAVNWCGFYVRDPLISTGNFEATPQLLLGPFQGHVACQTIAFGRGVCGTAASTAKTQLVPDVEAFPGHIACDAGSKSEIVVPIIKDGVVVGVLDVDCAMLNGFDEVDREWMEKLASIIAKSCDF